MRTQRLLLDKKLCKGNEERNKRPRRDVQIAGFGRRRFLLDRLRFLVRAFTCDVLAREIRLAEGSRHVPILTNMHAVRGPKKGTNEIQGILGVHRLPASFLLPPSAHRLEIDIETDWT